MKKFYTVGIALLAVLAFGALAASSASAAAWDEGTEEIKAADPVTLAGTLTLSIDGLFTATVDCEGLFDGTVGPGAADEVTKVLNAAGEETGTPLSGLAINCEVLAGNSCGAAGSLAELWPENLPWPTTLELMEPAAELILDLLGNAAKKSAYEILCVASGTSNLCEGIASAILTNGVNEVNGTYPNQKPAEDKCELGEGLLEGSGLVTLNNGGNLQVTD
jgi:hypothetical protein